MYLPCSEGTYPWWPQSGNFVGGSYSFMRIALAQTNPIVGDIPHNCRQIVDFAQRAKKQGADVVVFPELTVIGYPPKDLLLKPQFVDDNLRALGIVANHVKGIDAIVGYADRNPEPVGRPLRNSLAVLRDGKIVSRHYKTLLPTYDVFDESRYFEPGPADERSNLVQLAEAKAGLTICEDLWNDERLIGRRLYHQNPLTKLQACGAQMLINTSASPFVVAKHDFRIELFASQVRQVRVPLIYVNQVGGNDELVFDGNSVVMDGTGKVVAQARDFEEDLLVVELGADGVVQGGRVERHSRDVESIYKALVLGLRDYVRKCGFKKVVLGLSGGIDSALVCALAAATLGPEQVTGVAMPSRCSSDHSIADAKQLAANLGVSFQVVPIEPAHIAYEHMLASAFSGMKSDLTEENIQARIRGALLMAFSNKFGSLLLTTGNKSEIATGYCTLYGDMCGGLAVISDVPKMMVYQIAEFINQRAGRDLIPRNSITKAPSAELRPNQTDQDSLPPYEVLDAILLRYVEEEKGVPQIIAEGFDPATVMRVIRLIDMSEYKRRQGAPGIKVTSRAFGFGRRMPIAQNYRQMVPSSSQAMDALADMMKK
jgi:NAD+ synthase (glutamine-hydrolysing)